MNFLRQNDRNGQRQATQNWRAGQAVHSIKSSIGDNLYLMTLRQHVRLEHSDADRISAFIRMDRYFIHFIGDGRSATPMGHRANSHSYLLETAAPTDIGPHHTTDRHGDFLFTGFRMRLCDCIRGGVRRPRVVSQCYRPKRARLSPLVCSVLFPPSVVGSGPALLSVAVP